MKVYTVEWHGDYDGGEVLQVFDSQEKAGAWLAEAQASHQKAYLRKEKFINWLIKLRPPEHHYIRDSNGHPIHSSDKHKKWSRLWDKFCNIPVPHEYIIRDYSIREYEVQ